jgi:hypothetical protein
MDKKTIFVLLLFLSGWTAVGFADTLHLKNGNKIQGEITQQTDSMVKINISGVTITYYMDEIARIEKDGGSAEPASAPSSAPSRSVPQVIPAPAAREDSTQPSRDLVLRYLDLSGTSATLDQMFQDMIQNSSPQDALRLQQAYDLEEILQILVPIYQKHFTRDDLQKLVAFYQSPVARKLNEVTPGLVKDTLDAAMLYFRTKLPSPGATPQGQGS